MSDEPRLPAESGLPPLDADGMLQLYREMYLIRRMEELAAKAYTLRKILGFCHLYIGQEAVAVGAAAATTLDDYWFAAYREHGHALAKGTTPRAVMAELFGRQDGCSHGLGGSMHMFDKSVNFMGGYGIVGAHIPLATGAAWAAKQRGDGRVAVVFFGDGAANQGAYFEAMAMAQLWKLPVIFICENNAYAMGTSIERASALIDMSLRARGVGMVHEQVEGFDVRHVRERVGAAAKFAREGSGPVMLELKTYRYRGHSMSDPAKYRSKEEVEDIKNTSDALLLAAHHLKEEYKVSQEAIDAIREEIDGIAQDAYDFAEASPIPDPATLYDYTYAPGGE